MSRQLEAESAEYARQVWSRVEQKVGPLDPDGRGAWRARLKSHQASGLEPADAAADLIGLISAAVEIFQEGFRTFDTLVRAIDVGASVVEDNYDPVDVVGFVADTRVRLAHLHQKLARLAPYAGIPDFPPPEQLQAAVDEAEAEANRWAKTRARYGR